MTPPAFKASQASAFRLRRQHLHSDVATVASVVEVCRDTGGIQAQVMSAAETALWTRARGLTPADIRAALWERRAIVKTSAMRLTLHLIPADDFSMYISALKPMSTAILQKFFMRLRLKPSDIERVMTVLMDALADGPQTQQMLIARATEGAGRGVRAWLKLAWSAVRPLAVEGAIVYGPSRGVEATFVRTDRWLPRQPAMPVDVARVGLLRRFLSAFGPATAHDFSKWSGMKVSDAKAALEALGDEVVLVTVDGAHAWMLRCDVDELAASRLDAKAVRLLPAFDTLLLAHATKEHLVDARHYKRVYRPQGWISPVILQGERVIAVWFAKARGSDVQIDVQPFGRLERRVRAAIDAEMQALAGFVGRHCDVRYAG